VLGRLVRRVRERRKRRALSKLAGMHWTGAGQVQMEDRGGAVGTILEQMVLLAKRTVSAAMIAESQTSEIGQARCRSIWPDGRMDRWSCHSGDMGTLPKQTPLLAQRASLNARPNTRSQANTTHSHMQHHNDPHRHRQPPLRRRPDMRNDWPRRPMHMLLHRLVAG
jgi:hypothetical protein